MPGGLGPILDLGCTPCLPCDTGDIADGPDILLECGVFMPRRTKMEFVGWPNPWPTDEGYPWENKKYPCNYVGSFTPGGPPVWGARVTSGPQIHGGEIWTAYVEIYFANIALYTVCPDFNICGMNIIQGGYWRQPPPADLLDLGCFGSLTRYLGYDCDLNILFACSSLAQENSCNIMYLPSCYSVGTDTPPNIRFLWQLGDSYYPPCLTTPIAPTGVEIWFNVL